MNKNKLYHNLPEQVCSICGKKFKGYGNNAWHINDGICCDACNNRVVIPHRMQDYFKHGGE